MKYSILYQIIGPKVDQASVDFTSILQIMKQIESQFTRRKAKTTSEYLTFYKLNDLVSARQQQVKKEGKIALD